MSNQSRLKTWIILGIILSISFILADQYVRLIEIPTLEGKAKVKIDAGTQAGKVLRLKGKGLPSVNSYGRGDLLVNINVWTPQHLSSEEKKLLDQLRQSPNFKPNPGKGDKSFYDKMREFFHS